MKWTSLLTCYYCRKVSVSLDTIKTKNEIQLGQRWRRLLQTVWSTNNGWPFCSKRSLLELYFWTSFETWIQVPVSLCRQFSHPVISVSLLPASSAGQRSHNNRLYQLSALGGVVGEGGWRGIRRPVTQPPLFISRSTARELRHVPVDVLSFALAVTSPGTTGGPPCNSPSLAA